MKKWKWLLLIVGALVILFTFAFAGCASCNRFFKSCSADLSGGLERIVNVYSLDGELIATYEGKIDIDNNENGSIMFDLDGKRYVYYNAIIEVIEV